MPTSRNVTKPWVKRTFPSLSVKDLLEARDAYHVHLSQPETVVATAIGRFREYVGRPSSSDPADWEARDDEEPRTFSNSEITAESWPCVLVCVNKWYTRRELKKAKPEMLVPPRLYLPDGRVVPTCVIYVAESKKAPPPLGQLSFPSGLLGGGYPVLTVVQGEERIGSVGCLVTDGDLIYALTNRHVTGTVRRGEPRREIFTIVNGKRVRIGISHPKQVGKVPFETLYEGWPGKQVVTNLDAGLIEVDELSHWTSQVYGLGELGPIIDVHPHSLTLDFIGRKVRAFGGASGETAGVIHGLFYRYQSLGGLDYVADLLIGPEDPDSPTITRPGDSGTLWCLETQPEEKETSVPRRRRRRLSPLAVQWGGHQMEGLGGGHADLQLALATFASTICRVLDVELVPDHNTGFSEYWGKLGHFKIAAKACELVRDKKLKALLAANLDRIAYGDDVLGGVLPNYPHPRSQFVPLADVPDIVWRSTRQMDKANHFADMDQPGKGKYQGKTLLDLCRDDRNVDARVWASFYDSIGVTAAKNRGALPFRIWQLYEEMVGFLRKGKMAEFVCAAGVMAHYAADACQPLHISQYHDGRNEQEKGVHSDYETKMLDANRGEVVEGVNRALVGWKAVAGIQSGHEAAVQTIELMRGTHQDLPPLEIIETYNQCDRPRDMWPTLAKKTIACSARGCRNLANLWESAWKEGKGSAVAVGKLGPISTEKLRDLYGNKEFVKAMWLDDMIRAGIGVLDGSS